MLLLVAESAGARAVERWTFERLNSASDIVVIATMASTKPIDELLEIDGRHPKNQQPGLSIFERGTRELDGQLTTFKVNTVLKGTLKAKNIQLVHYRVGDGDPGRYQGGARVAEFRKEEYRLGRSSNSDQPGKPMATGRPQQYLLFLKVRKDGKFEPVSGQVDSAFSAIDVTPQDSFLDE
jgi:hypothetical protein